MNTSNEDISALKATYLAARAKLASLDKVIDAPLDPHFEEDKVDGYDALLQTAQLAYPVAEYAYITARNAYEDAFVRATGRLPPA